MIRKIHRWISLAFLAIWLIQAVTGTLSVFRWEIDEATVGGSHAPVDYAAVGARVDALNATAGTDVSSVWTSGSSAGRFDVHYDAHEEGRVMRIDGQGTILRDRSYDYVAAEGAIWDTITAVHTSLLAGDTGEWLISVSGLLLLTNIGLGLKLAWPNRKTWRKTLFGRPAGAPSALLYGWHRKVGLWFALPALFTLTAGVMLSFRDGIERSLGAEIVDPTVTAATAGQENIGFGAAVAAAQRRFPQGSISGVSLPNAEAPWYRVRMRNAGELPRKWGTSVVFVAASDGRVVGTYDAADPRPERVVVDSIYAIHTGQAGGLAGRIVALLVGFALIALIALGLPLWWKRRRPRTARTEA